MYKDLFHQFIVHDVMQTWLCVLRCCHTFRYIINNTEVRNFIHINVSLFSRETVGKFSGGHIWLSQIEMDTEFIRKTRCERRTVGQRTDDMHH